MASHDDIGSLIADGCDLAEQGDHLGAIDRFQAAIDAGAPRAGLNLGNSLLALGRFRAASKAFRAAGRAGEESAWFNLYLAEMELGHLANAASALARSVAVSDPKASAQLALDHLSRGDRDGAQQVIDQALATGSPSTWLDQVASLVRLRSPEAAMTEADERRLWGLCEYLDAAASELAIQLTRQGRQSELRRILQISQGRGPDTGQRIAKDLAERGEQEVAEAVLGCQRTLLAGE